MPTFRIHKTAGTIYVDGPTGTTSTTKPTFDQALQFAFNNASEGDGIYVYPDSYVAEGRAVMKVPINLRSNYARIELADGVDDHMIVTQIDSANHDVAGDHTRRPVEISGFHAIGNRANNTAVDFIRAEGDLTEAHVHHNFIEGFGQHAIHLTTGFAHGWGVYATSTRNMGGQSVYFNKSGWNWVFGGNNFDGGVYSDAKSPNWFIGNSIHEAEGTHGAELSSRDIFIGNCLIDTDKNGIYVPAGGRHAPSHDRVESCAEQQP